MNPDRPASADPQLILNSLRKSVRQALERKQRLQQYAVIWENNAPRAIGPDAPPDLAASDGRVAEPQIDYDENKNS